MQTIYDLLAGVVPWTFGEGAESSDLPPGYHANSSSKVSGGGKLPLPKTLAGLEGAFFEAEVPDFEPANANVLKALMLCSPGMVIPMNPLSADALADRGCFGTRKDHSFPRYLMATGIELGDSGIIFGVGLVAIQVNALGMGSHKIVEFEAIWTRDILDVITFIVEQSSGVLSTLEIIAESSSPAWVNVASCMASAFSKKPSGWQRHVDFAAGILGMKLHLVLNADSIQKDVVRSLQAAPPDALLLVSNQLRHAQLFRDVYAVSRELGRIEEFTLDQSAEWDDVMQELVLQLYFVRDLLRPSPPLKSWAQAAIRIKSFVCEYFVLSDRVTASLDKCPYPDPARMANFVIKLALLARDYHQAGGDLGRGLEDFSMESYGMELALHDKAIVPRPIFIGGRQFENLSAVPHVKVDDFKKPDRCGRIYFALDLPNLRFVVDHIGLHDYC